MMLVYKSVGNTIECKQPLRLANTYQIQPLDFIASRWNTRSNEPHSSRLEASGSRDPCVFFIIYPRLTRPTPFAREKTEATWYKGMERLDHRVSLLFHVLSDGYCLHGSVEHLSTRSTFMVKVLLYPDGEELTFACYLSIILIRANILICLFFFKYKNFSI